jgi:GT2 family glycosyltransferase
MEPMHLLFMVLLIPQIGISMPLSVYWFIVLMRIGQTIRRLPTGRDGIALSEARTEPDPSVLVIVPAHNEAGSIAPLIRSLREQDHPRFHAVLALDRCTDGTAAVARREIGNDPRFELVQIEHCPEGWAGKVNAVRTAVESCSFASGADYLLFTDADCVLHPSCLRAATALSEARGLDLLSFLSEYPPESWFEWLVQPLAGFELMRQYPLLRANRTDERQRPFANGQFMLFRAPVYRAFGGHAVAKDELLEDLALARAVKRHGGRGGVLLGGGIVRCRMYDSWGEFRRGWKRIYTEAAQRRSDRLREAGWRVTGLGVIMPMLSLVMGLGSAAACYAWGEVPWYCLIPLFSLLAGLLPYGLAMARVHAMANSPRIGAVLAPLGALLVGSVLFRAARELSTGRPTHWGGRAYHRADRSRIPAADGDKAGTA